MAPEHSHRRKFHRAQEHLNDFKTRVDGWGQTWKQTARIEPDARGKNYYILHIEPGDLPEGLPTILGDAVQNLRASLDHLVFELGSKAGPLTEKEAKESKFPIIGAKDGADVAVKDFLNSRRMNLAKVGSEACAVIERLQPYASAKVGLTDQTYRGDFLWQLDQLAKIDRHRSLHLVGLFVQGATWHVQNAVITDEGSFSHVTQIIPPGEAIVLHAPFDRLDVSRDVKVDIKIALEVALQEREIAPGLCDPIAEVISDISRYIATSVFPPLEALL